jgi:hypothetical protein
VKPYVEGLCATRRGTEFSRFSSACHRRRRIAVSWWTQCVTHRDCAVSQRGHLIARTWSTQEFGRLGDETMTKSVDGATRQLSWLKLSRPSNLAVAFLRLALGAGFLSAVADRMGFWGPPGNLFGLVGQFPQFLALHREAQSLVPSCMSSIAWSIRHNRRGWTGDSPDTGIINTGGSVADGDDRTGICFGNDFRARSSRAPELLRFRVLGSVPPSCIAGPRQPDHRSISRVEEPAPGATSGFTRELKT